MALAANRRDSYVDEELLLKFPTRDKRARLDERMGASQFGTACCALLEAHPRPHRQPLQTKRSSLAVADCWFGMSGVSV